MLPSDPRLNFDTRLLDRMPVATFVCEAGCGRIRYYNRRAVELWGIDPHRDSSGCSSYGCSAFKLLAPDGTPLCCNQAPMCSVLHQGVEVRDQEAIVERPDGSRSHVVVNVEPIRDEHGKIVAAIGTFQEVTEHKRTQEALDRSEESFRLLVDGVLDYAIFMLDAEGRVINWNTGAERIKGYTAEQIIGRHFSCFYTPEDIARDKPGRELEIAAATGRFMDEGWRLRRDGSRFWASVAVTALRDPGGKLRGFAKVTQDISERKRSEEALRNAVAEARETYQELLFQKFALDQHAIVAVTDPKGRITYANDKFCQISKYSQEELLGQDHRIVNSGYHPKSFFKQMYATISQGNVWRGDVRNRAKDGSIYWLSTTIVPFKDVSGRISRYVVIRADITERKRIEEQLHEAKEAAEKANAAKDHFLAVLSHELRTPLTPVVATTGMMQEDQRLPEDIRQDVQMIRRNIELETRLIDDLLDVTRIARGKLELDIRVVDAAAVLQEAVKICQPDAQARNLSLRIEAKQGQGMVRADAARLQQVFWNLLRNSIKFTPPGGSILARCHVNGDGRLIAQVADTGIGIEPEAAERIFEAFEQADRSVTRQFGGLGLGLAICKMIVSQHGGTIRASSEGKGRGTTITLELPLVEEQLPPGGPAGRDVQVPGASAGSSAKARILLVEDHADTIRILSRILRSRGHDVLTATSVGAALSVAEQAHFDLLLSDLGLPDGTGLDLLRQLGARHPALKAIALSGYGQEHDVQSSRDAGFIAHLTKPVDLQKLEATIARVLSGSTPVEV